MAAPALDVITIGRASVDLYGQQVGGRLEDMASVLQGGRRLPGEHRDRHRAPRPAIRPDHPRRRRGDGPLHPRAAARARASRPAGVRTDPDRLTALVILGVRDDEHLPADLRARELRRHGPRRERHRRGLRRLGRRGRRDRHAFLEAERRRGGADEGDPHRARARPARGVRHRLPARTSGASSATAPARRAMSPRAP